MKTAIFFVLLLAFVNVQAKKKKQKHDAVPKDNMFTGFRVPLFAMRFPVFGGEALTRQDNVKPSELTFNDGKDAKLKTKTKTFNSTHGPYKTYTITSVTTSGNKTNPQVFEKVIKSVTTMAKNGTGKNITLPQIKETQFSIFRPFSVFGGFKGFNDDSSKECSDKKPCAAEQFCDNFFGVCKKQVGKGQACSQKDQCSKKSGDLQCTWGKCIVNSDVGGLGTFCDDHKDCHSSAGQEAGCFPQNDISRYSKVCIAKLQEGVTCGRKRLLDVFEDENDEDSQLCQGSLVCRTVGFFGRKICQKAATSSVSDYHRVVTKKSKHHRHHKRHY
ncbi:uncharacterized protein LOC116308183 [Actinia tenebrosa]|uniref:Uncharacterized protein LOC116308183 n=1 Tax=Actinia tenebrosa TaxID=6105 RepID=A0A6P8J372_ACTTE|nr:uncharacterized protein LOC116308183 [Actinia tenebrosa]